MISGDSEMQLEALRPTCSVCCGVLDGSSLIIRQLSCLHLFCQHCLQELASGGGVWCPFEEMVVEEIQAAGVSRAFTAAQNYCVDPSSFPQALNYLERSFSLVKVPCVWTTINGNCPNPLFCRFDHRFDYFRKHPCPAFKARGECWRGECCLFFHQLPAVEISVTIQSKSFWLHISQQSGPAREVIDCYGAEFVSHEMLEVTYQTEKKWVFENKQGELPTVFPPGVQETISYAADTYKSFVDVETFRVYFRPQFLAMSDNSTRRVTCTSVCQNSSPAGSVVFKVRQDWAGDFLARFQGLEYAVNGVVVGLKQFNWLKSNGFGYCNGKITGFAADLNNLLVVKPEFDEFEDIIDIPFEYNPNIHNIAGKNLAILPGKLVGLREDVRSVCTSTVGLQPFSAYNQPPAPYVPPVTVKQSLPVNPPVISQPPAPYFPPVIANHSLPVLPVNPPVIYQSSISGLELQEEMKIEEMVRQTKPNVTVLSIITLQPTPASKAFESNLEHISMTTGCRPNTMKLFYGTCGEKPKAVADTGLNGRKVKGKFGHGIYFYENLSAAERFAHKLPNNEKQILVCEVIVGDCLKTKPHFFTCAPINYQTNSQYDSVQGMQRGSRLWVVFEDNMACARFIVIYR